MKNCYTCKTNKEYLEFSKDSKIKDGLANYCKSCVKIKSKQPKGALARAKAWKKYYQKPQIKERIRELRRKNRKREDQQRSLRKTFDPFFKAKCNLRSRLLIALKSKKWNKNSKFAEYIGCSKEEFMVHMQSKFTEGMTWVNQGDWHIDHIIPLSSAKTENELYKLCHYTNLQPLWAIDNFKKSNK